MMAIQPISALSPGRSNCSGESRRKAGMAITRSPVSASLAQLRSSTTKTSGLSLSLRIASSFLRARFLKQNVGATRHERRDDAVGADVAISLVAGLDGAKAVWAGRQRQIKTLGGARRNLALKLDVPRGALAEQAHLPVREGTNPRRGVESQLDVAAEIALVVDVARGAMRAFGQVLQSAHAGLRAAAARAEQLPSHRHDALPRRGQKQFHGVVWRGGP